jgi:hypothetical protein
MSDTSRRSSSVSCAASADSSSSSPCKGSTPPEQHRSVGRHRMPAHKSPGLGSTLKEVVQGHYLAGSCSLDLPLMQWDITAPLA